MTLDEAESIPSNTPCDLCGEPASWLSGDGTDDGTMALCDRCHRLEDQR